MPTGPESKDPSQNQDEPIIIGGNIPDSFTSSVNTENAGDFKYPEQQEQKNPIPAQIEALKKDPDFKSLSQEQVKDKVMDVVIEIFTQQKKNLRDNKDEIQKEIDRCLAFLSENEPSAAAQNPNPDMPAVPVAPERPKTKEQIEAATLEARTDTLTSFLFSDFAVVHCLLLIIRTDR